MATLVALGILLLATAALFSISRALREATVELDESIGEPRQDNV